MLRRRFYKTVFVSNLVTTGLSLHHLWNHHIHILISLFIHFLSWHRVYRGLPFVPSSLLQQWGNLGEVVALPPVSFLAPPLAPPPLRLSFLLSPVLPFSVLFSLALQILFPIILLFLPKLPQPQPSPAEAPKVPLISSIGAPKVPFVLVNVFTCGIDFWVRRDWELEGPTNFYDRSGENTLHSAIWLCLFFFNLKACVVLLDANWCWIWELLFLSFWISCWKFFRFVSVFQILKHAMFS